MNITMPVLLNFNTMDILDKFDAQECPMHGEKLNSLPDQVPVVIHLQCCSDCQPKLCPNFTR